MKSGSLRVRFPNAHGRAALDAVIVNTAGGMTGGDRFGIDIDVGAGANLTVTTAAAEKIYRSLGPDTEIGVETRRRSAQRTRLAAAGNDPVRSCTAAPHDRCRSRRRCRAAAGRGHRVWPRGHGRNRRPRISVRPLARARRRRAGLCRDDTARWRRSRSGLMTPRLPGRARPWRACSNLPAMKERSRRSAPSSKILPAKSASPLEWVRVCAPRRGRRRRFAPRSRRDTADMGRRSVAAAVVELAHDPEKWKPAFG